MTDPILRAMSWAIYPRAEGTLSEYMTQIEIEDEAGGEFLKISQPLAGPELSGGAIAITPEEWPTIRAALDAAFREIEEHGKNP